MAFGKTGQTDQAGLSMTSVARDSGYEYLVVVMNCPVVNPDGSTTKAHYADTRKLYKWAFNKFTYETLLSKNAPVDELTVNLAWNTDTVSLVPKEDFATLINTDLDKKTILPVVTLTTKVVDAPVQKGQVYGKVELFINVDQKIGEVELVAAESVDRSQVFVYLGKHPALFCLTMVFGLHSPSGLVAHRLCDSQCCTQPQQKTQENETRKEV